MAKGIKVNIDNWPMVYETLVAIEKTSSYLGGLTDLNSEWEEPETPFYVVIPEENEALKGGGLYVMVLDWAWDRHFKFEDEPKDNEFVSVKCLRPDVIGFIKE